MDIAIEKKKGFKKKHIPYWEPCCWHSSSG